MTVDADTSIAVVLIKFIVVSMSFIIIFVL